MTGTALPPRAWADASARLARRVTARARLQAFLRPFAVGLVVAAVAAILVRTSLDAGTKKARATLVCLAGAGAVVGLLRARRARPVALADAAWALDRLSSARERGLTAALAEPRAAEEAAASLAGTAPARVRLKPPAGLVATASAALLATIAWAWPAPEAGDAGEPRAATARPGAAGASVAEARAREERAESLSREARAVAEAREAVGLPARTALAPSRVAERLGSRESLEAARRALARAGGASPDAPATDADLDAIARRLADDPAARAEALRREALAARAASVPPRVPPARQETVARYLALRAAAREDAR